MLKQYLLPAIWLICGLPALAQDVYTISGGEIIFQSARVEQNGEDINTNLRFSAWFHLGEYIHMDLGDHFGIFSGIGLRNVGFITEENHIKTKYRSYNLGMPIALKLGSFKQNLYIFGGAEYEWMLHFKEKVIVNGDKTKYSKWFSNATPDFIPSAFIGIQFPAGIQVKFRYYLDDFLNKNYNDGGVNNNFTTFNKTQVWYISLSYQIRNNKIKNYKPITTEMAMH